MFTPPFPRRGKRVFEQGVVYDMCMDDRTYNLDQNKIVRKYLRNNATPQETKLWNELRNKKLGNKFRRQHGIVNYIVDFYCPKKKLAIEIDGNEHLQNKEYDKERTESFKILGVKVIRFWNSEVDKNINEVLSKIRNELN